jgi:hypothetical protein
MENTLPLTTSTLLLSLSAFNHSLTKPDLDYHAYADAARAADMLELELALRAASGDAVAAEYLGE